MKKIIHIFKEKVLPHIKQKFVYRVLLLAIFLWMVPYLAELDLIKFSTVRIIGTILIYSVVALGINLLLGYSGLISLGTAGFMGFGAYFFQYFSTNYYDGFIIAALVTILVTGLLGALIGLMSLRIEGIYLAIGTLFIGEILSQIFKNVEWFSGGFSPQRFHYPQFNFFGNIIELELEHVYWMIVIVLALMMIVFYNIIHSRTGRGLMAMSRSNHAAQAMGISLLKYRLIAFVTATVFASIGGILYISYFLKNYPTNWDLELSLFIIAMVVVGGYKSIFGTLIGAFVIHGVPNLFLKDLFESFPKMNYIFNGLLIIVVIMFYPNGLVHLWQDAKKLYYKIKSYFKKAVKSDG